jgi:putative transposase
MKRKRFSEEQIIGILKEHELGAKTADVCRKHGISEATFSKRKSKYGGLGVSEARRLKALEAENTKMKRLLADAMLDNAAVKDLVATIGIPSIQENLFRTLSSRVLMGACAWSASAFFVISHGHAPQLLGMSIKRDRSNSASETIQFL